jgi:transposase
MYQHYLGVDLHKQRTYVVLMGADGIVSDQRRLPNDAMPAYIAQLPKNTFAVLETTSNWSYLYDVLEAHVACVVLAHPKQVRAIAAARVKNDRIDATTLAHLARANLLPTSYAAPQTIRELREVVRHRAKLVRERTRHKNRIHRVLSIYNLQPPCSDLFGKQGRAFLEAIQERLSATHQTLIADYMLMIDTLGEPIKHLDKRLWEWSKTDPRAALLMTMPGIGIYSAAIILAEIGNIARFRGAKQLCSFAGLVPSTRSSDMQVHHGRITREGSSWLRWIMVSAAHSAPRRSPKLQAFLDRIAHKHGRKTARVALARKMLGIIFYMLQRNEPYQEAYPLS